MRLFRAGTTGANGSSVDGWASHACAPGVSVELEDHRDRPVGVLEPTTPSLTGEAPMTASPSERVGLGSIETIKLGMPEPTAASPPPLGTATPTAVVLAFNAGLLRHWYGAAARGTRLNLG
jgi:hypothetical protein